MKFIKHFLFIFLLPIVCFGKSISPYGTWKSPISESMVAKDSISFESLKIDPVHPDKIYWLALYPAEEGRATISQYSHGKIQMCLPKNFSARTQAHSYGGGEFTVYDNTIFFSNEKDNRLYKLEGCNGTPIPLTSPGDFRYADCSVNSSKNKLYCIREEFFKNKKSEDSIISIDLKTHDMKIVEKGQDFYSSPIVSPDGRNLAWLSWNLPHMMFDTTQLWLADINEDGSVKNKKLILGKKDISIFQPQWSPSNVLYFISDQTGWWNLYRYQRNKIESVYLTPAEFGIVSWEFGPSTYSFVNDNLIAASYLKQGKGYFGFIDVNKKQMQTLNFPYTEFASVKSNPQNVYFFAGGLYSNPAVVELNATTHKTKELQTSLSLNLNHDFISVPKHIEYKALDGKINYAYYYPPKNPNYEAPKGEKPPLIVLVHGGPTARAAASLVLSKQFWTSRGYAILELNYEGSSGYGRAYRDLLKGRWGIGDRAAAISGALYLVQKGLADPKRLIIKGESAGGYTVLRVLTTSSVFQVGTDYFGVSNLETEYQTTHKLESRYWVGLIGPYPEKKAIYRERSPYFSIDKLSGALLILQGMEDEPVPPAQSEMIYETAKKAGKTVAYITFQNEGHGFRHAESRIKSLEAEQYFYNTIFGMPVKNIKPPIDIANLPRKI